MGSQEPSARVAPKYGKSDGHDAAQIMELSGLVLDPWQRDALDDWMARTKTGSWACPSCGLSVPRQNGKTGLIQARAIPGMLLFNEQVIYTAHLQKTATETFEEMRDLFEGPALKKYVAPEGIKSALGREQIILRTGARIKFLARTRNGGRGQHGDLLIFDEAQELTDSQQASFLPAISASANPQTIQTGTPPEPQSQGNVFKDLRRKALNGETKKTAWEEFSVDEIGDVADRERWAQTNPALGRRIKLSTVQTELEQMDPDTFARERLGWWPPVEENRLEAIIDEKTWESCKSSEPKPEGKTAYGVKFSADGSEVCLCGAVCPANGPARISMIERKSTSQGTRWLAEWLNARAGKASCVVIDGRNGVDLLIDRISENWPAKGAVIKANTGNVIAAASLLITELSEQTVTWYAPQLALHDSAVSSTKRKISGGFGFGGDDSTPIEAAALALLGARTSKRNPNRKMRVG